MDVSWPQPPLKKKILKSKNLAGFQPIPLGLKKKKDKPGFYFANDNFRNNESSFITSIALVRSSSVALTTWK